MQSYENCDVNFVDDRRKKYDMNAIHFQKTMAEISKLRSRSLLFDIVIRTGDRSFQAHKLLLAASSDYFRALFTKFESNQSEIQIDAISAVGIENVLNFIYTAKLELSLLNVQEVLAAANYFQLTTVIDACLNFLEGELDTENCIDMLIIAENYSLLSLRDKILKFICAHISEIARGGDEFWRLQANQIEQLLSSDLPVDCSEAEILRITLTWLTKSECDEKDHQAILKDIDFREVSVNEVERVMKSLDIKRSEPLYTAVWSQTHPLQSGALSSSDNKLLNHRGMELAIIKIGGFEMTGITNEITFSFPSATNPPTIHEPWRYLTEIPHIKQGSYGIAVLNNCIYVIGGSYDINLDNEDVHPFGFKYNPLSSEWSTIKPMNFDRCRFSLNVLEGSLIAVGGHSEVLFQRLNDGHHEGQNVATVERYDIHADSWTILTSLPEYRSQHAGASYESHLYIAGGIDHYGNVLESFHQYDNASDRWSKLCNLTPRADHVMLCVDKRIYICGGWNEIDGQRRLLTAIECFDIKSSTISTITHIPTPRFHAGITLIGHKIYVIGGFASDDIFRHTATKIEIYDIGEDKWYFPEKYPKHIWEHMLTSIYIPKEVSVK